MAQGARLSDMQIETIRAVFAEGGSLGEAAREAGCAKNSARKYAPPPNDELAQLRTQKRADIITRIAEVRSLYLEHLAQPDVMSIATARDAATIVGILTDKHQLLSGAATERKEVSAIDPDRLTPEEKAQAARLRAKLLGEVAV